MYKYVCSGTPEHFSYSASETKTEPCEVCGASTQVVSEAESTVEPVYARFFDEESTRMWSSDQDINVLFLRSVQNYMNDQLKARGHLFLNELYDALGLSRTRGGQLVGWAYSPDKGVEIGIQEGENGLLLDFNVEGEIIDKIEEKT